MLLHLNAQINGSNVKCDQAAQNRQSLNQDLVVENRCKKLLKYHIIQNCA